MSGNGIERPMRMLLIGAGLVARTGGSAAVLQLARRSPHGIRVRVFDRGVLDATYLAHPAYAGGEPGQGKATALVASLGRRGVDAEAFEGNLTRWPIDAFRADLALVALDEEPARLAAQTRLRAAGTPALFAGVADDATVHVIGARAGEPCYACTGQEEVPLVATPCRPQAVAPSARETAATAALAALGRHLPEIASDALGGRGLGELLVLPRDGEDGIVRARIRRAPGCMGGHDAPLPELGGIRVDASTTLGVVFGAARALLCCEDAVSARLRLESVSLRFDYTCADCDAGPVPGRELTRSWPARERCTGCGSTDVRPLTRLGDLSEPEARRLDLLGHRLADLGVVPGSAYVASDDVRVRLDVRGARPATRVPLMTALGEER